jgi:hypothetical protein
VCDVEREGGLRREIGSSQVRTGVDHGNCDLARGAKDALGDYVGVGGGVLPLERAQHVRLRKAGLGRGGAGRGTLEERDSGRSGKQLRKATRARNLGDANARQAA